MTQIGPVRPPQPIPDPNLLQPQTGQRQSTPAFFLRSTPPIFTVLNVGGSNTNQDFAFKALQLPAPPRPEFARFFLPRVAGKVEVSALVHARALGAPRVSTQFAVSSLIHGRALGTHVVSVSNLPPDPPDPPEPPETPHVTLTGGPRSIKGVRRRNTRDKD